MKKLLVAAAAGLAGALALRKAQQGRKEQDLWSEATDPVGPSTA